tara:strand:- start:2663 stop:4528 length:1866 start_codon:yes stop_codon:yes gene_type:complete
MANGFDYESPINRLLSVTIPQFLDSQLNRQERARQFDEQLALRQQQFDAQMAQQKRQNDILDKTLQREEKDRTNAERFEVENSFLKEVSLERDPENAMRLLENMEFTSPKGISLSRLMRKNIEIGEEANTNLINQYSSILPDEIVSNLRDTASWSSPLSHQGIADIMDVYESKEKLADTKFKNVRDTYLKKLQTLSKMKESLTSQIGSMGFLQEGDPGFAAVVQARNDLSNIDTRLDNTFLEFSEFLSKESGIEGFTPYTPSVMNKGEFPKRTLTIGVDLRREDVSKLPAGTKFEMEGGVYKIGENNIIEAVDEADNAIFDKALSNELSDVYIDGIPTFAEPTPPVTPEPMLEVGEDDSGAAARLSEKTYQGSESVQGAFEDLLRAAPSQQRDIGTGEGGVLTFGGAPKTDIDGLRNAEKGLSIEFMKLQSLREKWRESLPSSDTEAESVNREYVDNIDKANKELTFLLRNAYQAYYNEENPKIKERYKKALDRAVSKIEKENESYQKMKDYKGRYKSWEKRSQAYPLISQETMAVANAVKTSARLPGSAQEDLKPNEVSSQDVEEQLRQSFNELSEDIRIGVYNDDFENYKTAMMTGIQNAGVYGKAPQDEVMKLLNALQ